jgi:sugar/nucleoside kinase (ribokinase family)
VASRGAYVGVNGKVYHQRFIRQKTLIPIGVGDSFGAAFLASMVYEPKNYVKALRWGLVNSGCNVAAVGAQLGILTRLEIEKLA